MKKQIAVLLCFIGIIFSAYAENDILPITVPSSIPMPPGFGGPQDQFSSAPVVPLEILVKGRQGVVDYLLMQVDHVTIEVTGDSIVSKDGLFRYFGMDQLINMGYRHRGSFSELSDALSDTVFSQNVIPTPQGYYDVRVEVLYYTSDGRQAFQGNGYLNITEQPDGSLTSESFKPWMSLNSSLALRSTDMISAAKWIGNNYTAPEDLALFWDGERLLVMVPSRILENGFLGIAVPSSKGQGSSVIAWDLKRGTSITGKQFRAFLGQTGSEIRTLRNPKVLDVGDTQFGEDNGQLYGNFPLVELVVEQSFKDSFNFEVPVWGSDIKVHPDQVFVTPIALGDKEPTTLILGQEFEVPTPIGDWFITLPAGIYHIRTVFLKVLSWDSDPFVKG